MRIVETNSPSTRMKDLSARISAWKMAIEFEGYKDKKYFEFCRNKMLKLGGELVRIAQHVKYTEEKREEQHKSRYQKNKKEMRS